MCNYLQVIVINLEADESMCDKYYLLSLEKKYFIGHESNTETSHCLKKEKTFMVVIALHKIMQVDTK